MERKASAQVYSAKENAAKLGRYPDVPAENNAVCVCVNGR